MAYWLVKTEPEAYSIEQFSKEKRTLWEGVRNYQARNFLRDMQKGDEVLFYHSNAQPPAIVGLAKVNGLAVPDPSQFDKLDSHFDPKASRDNPRWFSPELRFVKSFKKPVSITELREKAGLKNMLLLQKGSRLSVLPVTDREFEIIQEMSES